MTEPLSDAELTDWRDDLEGPPPWDFAADADDRDWQLSVLATIAALRSRITELEGERDYWHLAHEEAVEVWSCRAATAEARVESLERVVAQGTPLSVRWCVRWPHGMVVVEGDPLFPRCGACGPCRWDAALASLTTATTERAPTPTTPGTDESEMSVEGARSDISGP